jgi:S-adenosylmethionine:tRNA ribosyltransferase-isomerase
MVAAQHPPVGLLPEVAPRLDPSVERLIRLDRGRVALSAFGPGLVDALGPGDVLVVNGAGTLPASLRLDSGVELRLASRVSRDVWRAVVLDHADWRTPTELRAPADLGPGAHLLDNGAPIELLERSGRSLSVRVALSDVLRAGRPVQYSYLRDDVALGQVQTPLSGAGWAMEMPSAGRPLRWKTLLALRRKGVRVVSLLHAAGLSSVDGGALDATLPWPERSEIGQAAVDTIHGAQRVVAAGTTVVRALEDNVRRFGALRAGHWTSELVLGPSTRPQVVDGVLTNLHEPGESHFELLQAFAPRAHLLRVNRLARRSGLRAHEFGDSVLILNDQP